MPQWAKVLLGSLAVMSGAIAPALIIELLQQGQHYRPELARPAEQHPRVATEAEQQSQTDRNAAQPFPTFIPPVAAEDQNEKSRNQTERDQKEIPPPDYFVIGRWAFKITDLAIAIFTFFLVIVGAVQALQLRRTIRAMERTERRQLRAYLHVHDVRMKEMNSVTYGPNIQIIIRNHGRTPARSINNTFKCLALRSPVERRFDLTDAQVVEVGDLGPRQRVFSSPSYPNSYWRDLKARLNAERSEFRFYVFGRLDYEDVFGDKWSTEYRYFLLIDATGIPNDASLVMEGRAGNRTS